MCFFLVGSVSKARFPYIRRCTASSMFTWTLKMMASKRNLHRKSCRFQVLFSSAEWKQFPRDGKEVVEFATFSLHITFTYVCITGFYYLDYNISYHMCMYIYIYCIYFNTVLVSFSLIILSVSHLSKIVVFLIISHGTEALGIVLRFWHCSDASAHLPWIASQSPTFMANKPHLPYAPPLDFQRFNRPSYESSAKKQLFISPLSNGKKNILTSGKKKHLSLQWNTKKDPSSKAINELVPKPPTSINPILGPFGRSGRRDGSHPNSMIPSDDFVKLWTWVLPKHFV